jgi:hypothetical protein
MTAEIFATRMFSWLPLVACILLSDVQVRGQAQPESEVIIAEGVGVDVEGARKDAYRNAVRQAVGAYVDSETVVENDELITDRIVMLSPAFVEKAEPIAGTEKREEGLVRLRVRAHVRITKLLDALAEGKIKTRPVTRKVDTTSLLAELSTKSDQHEARRDILAKLMSDYPESCLTVEQSGKESIEKTPDGRLLLNVPLVIRPNQESYTVFSKTLCEVLSATKRPSGEFSVDGAKYGPNAEYAKEDVAYDVKGAFTDTNKMLGVFPSSLQDEIRKSCDAEGRSPIVGLGSAYPLWNGADREGIGSLYYETWRKLRENKNDDWIVICVTSAKKDFRQTNWKWFQVTGDEYKEWFAATPETFRCRTQLVDKDGEEVAGEAIELGKIGAGRLYDKLLWCVPLYVRLHNSWWYTPELRMVRRIEIDAEDAANIEAIRVVLERGEPGKR